MKKVPFMTELEYEKEQARQAYEELRAEKRELETQLQNAIVPKFAGGQKVWYIGPEDTVVCFVIDEMLIRVNSQGFDITYKEQGFLEVPETFLFATRAEAEKALAERGDA